MVFPVLCLDLFLSLLHTKLSLYQGEAQCPAEEKENCGKSPLTNAKKSCGKIDTRTSKRRNDI
jgi:hypothetical protein